MKLSNKIIKKLTFSLIFLVYFLSAAGLYNSMDATQYFTAEALLSNFHPAIEIFEENPHYFVFPDIIYHQGHTFGARGYLNSVLHIPAHLVSSITKSFFTTNLFPEQAVFASDFNYKLSVTSFYVIYTLFGIYFLNETILLATKNKYISYLTSIFVAFGTYSWKYSSSYTRQGMIVFFIGLGLYLVFKIVNEKSENSLGVLLILWALSFGIDIPLFVGFSLFLTVYFSLKKTYQGVSVVLSKKV